MKTFESVLHVIMGFIATIFNLRLLLTLREYKQLPPENNKNPVIWVDVDIVGNDWDWCKAWLGSAYGGKEYWSKERVMDTLKDSLEYDIGASLGWFVVFSLGVLLGMNL
tara:strand:+ start:1053 stop:1379 length:327 start_codon:yes stop_codon:yes gene_type:complete